jgi:drug/metabolite transporter (DMT)-like permease
MNAHPLITVSYHSLVTTVMSGLGLLAIPSLSFVVPKTATQIFYFLLIGVFGFAMQIALAAGVQRVKASKAALTSYTNMIFSLVCDLVVFGHVPGWLSLTGIVVIMVNAFVVIKYKPEDNDTQYTSIPLEEFDIEDEEP